MRAERVGRAREAEKRGEANRPKEELWARRPRGCIAEGAGLTGKRSWGKGRYTQPLSWRSLEVRVCVGGVVRSAGRSHRYWVSLAPGLFGS